MHIMLTQLWNDFDFDCVVLLLFCCTNEMQSANDIDAKCLWHRRHIADGCVCMWIDLMRWCEMGYSYIVANTCGYLADCRRQSVYIS